MTRRDEEPGYCRDINLKRKKGKTENEKLCGNGHNKMLKNCVGFFPGFIIMLLFVVVVDDDEDENA